MKTMTEAFIQEKFQLIDNKVSVILSKKYWILYVGIIATICSLAVYSPVLGLHGDNTHWSRKVYEAQVNHPLTPIDVEKEYSPPSTQYGITSHLDKIAFRITVPILGHLFHTGANSWYLFSVLSGLLFFPLLASTLYKYCQNKLFATYITWAFAITFTGTRFFIDKGFCDGLAWLLLLLPIRFSNSIVIFLSIISASFVDERALIASASIPLFYFIINSSKEETIFHLIKKNINIFNPCLLAWIVYFGIRYVLSSKFNLHTGTTLLLDKEIFWHHAQNSLPYVVVSVFQFLWIWFIIGFVHLYVNNHWTVFGSFLIVALLLFFTSLIVLDIDRSLGFAIILLVSTFCLNSISISRKINFSRFCFLGGFLLIIPYKTIFIDVYRAYRIFW